MSFPFIIRQMSAPKRAIVLQGRSLPFQGVTWGGDQRLDVNYYPGNPVADTQVIGSTWKNTTIEGRWSDIFLYEDRNKASLANFPRLQDAARPDASAGGLTGGDTFASGGSVSDQDARRARTLRDAFTMVRKEGGLLQVEWGSIVRYGFISSDSFSHLREEDIEFEVEFTWIGDTPSKPKFKPPSTDMLSLLKQMLALMDDVINSLLTAVFKANMWLARVNQTIAKLGSFVTDLIGALDKLVSFVFAPSDVDGNIRGALTSIRLAARDLLNTLDQGQSAVIEGALLGSPAVIAMNYMAESQLRSSTMLLAAQAALQERVIAAANISELLGTFATPGGVTLRQVSTRFYGTPDNWGVIAKFNGLASSIVPRGTLIRVPKL